VEEPRHQTVLKPGFLVRPGQVADEIVGGFAKREFRDPCVFFPNAGFGDGVVEGLDGVCDVLRQGRGLPFDRYQPQLTEQHEQWGCGG